MDKTYMEKEIRLRADVNYKNEISHGNPLSVYKEEIADDVTKHLFNITKNNNLLTFVVLFAAFEITIEKIIDRKNIVVNTPIMEGQTKSCSASIANAYIPFECDIDAEMSVKDFIKKFKDIVVEKYQNSLYTQNASASPLVSEIIFCIEGIHCKDNLREAGTLFEAVIEEDKLYLTCTYKAGLYTEYYIQKICKAYSYVLKQMVDNVNICIKDIELIDAAEKNKLFHFNEDYSMINDLPIYQRFEEQAEKTPEAKAVDIFYNSSEILKNFENSGNKKDKTWKKCCFKQNPYLVCLTKQVEFIKEKEQETYAIRTHLRNTIIVNQNVLQLLCYLNGTNTLNSIYDEIINHDAYYYMEDRTVSEHSWKDERTVTEMICNHDIHTFLRFIQTMQHANLISLEQLKTLDKGISDPLHILKPLRERSRNNSGDGNESSTILLLGDTPGEATVGLLHIASFLRRNGIEAYCQFNDLNDTYTSLHENVICLLKRYQPNIVGISAKWFPHIARVLAICEIIKNYNSNIKIVVGGNTASLYPENFIQYDTIDYVVCGDGELPILRICKGEEDIPNCIYKKNGEIIKNEITYIQYDHNSSEIYLSDLEEIIIDQDNILTMPYIYIYTGKGCAMNCFYCGGCNEAQSLEFSRNHPFIRKYDEARKDILEASKFTSTFMFVDSFSFDTEKYYSELWNGLDLTNHFCDFYFYKLPSFEFIIQMCNVFKYVYINIDLCSLSERHREEMFKQKVIKPLPSDSELFKFFEMCKQLDNLEIGLSLISGLPFYEEADFEAGKQVLKQLKKYKNFKGLEWGRLHAQPMAPILKSCAEYDMKSQAATFEEFLEYSKKNMEESSYPDIYSFHVPYIYFDNDMENSKITKYFGEINNALREQKPYQGVYESVTYDELNQTSNQLARLLLQNGVKENDVVGIMLDEPLEVIIAIWAVLKAGAVYCPIDLSSPQARIENIVKSCKAKILIVPQNLHMDDPVKTISIIYKDLLKYDRSNLNITVPQKALAYIIFTSGTTGEPKGVCIKHEGLSNLFRWRIENYNFTPQDATLQLLPYFFDGYATNLYSALLSGGTLVLMNDNARKDMLCIKEVILHKKISNMSIVPSMFQAIVESTDMENLESLKCVVLAAEKAGRELIKQCLKGLPKLTFINEYGPTENTIVATANIGMTEANTNVIGKPIKNVHAFILNSSGDMLPAGLYGEICLSGAGLAEGYLNNSSGENTSFTMNTWEGKNMYQTGDIGRWMENGTIEFYGREDGQVKIRGHRIETKGIELYLESLPNIVRAVVEGIELSGEMRLAAYLETKGKVLDISDIKEQMKSHIPECAIPSYFYQMEEFPVLSNGKIDRQNLGKVVILQGKGENDRELNKAEAAVTEIWKSILNLEAIRLTDNFFDIGGNSISLMRMQAEIEQKFDVAIPVAELFQYTTILKLSDYLNEKVKQSLAEKVNYACITLPDEYYITSKKEVTVVELLDENKRKQLDELQKKGGLELNSILCGLYCYLLSKICGQSDMTYYTIHSDLNICHSIEADFSKMEDFGVLFQLIEKSRSSECFSNKFMDDLSGITRNTNGVIPVIVLQCSTLTEALKEKESTLAFSIDTGEKVKITISCAAYNGTYLNLKAIMEMYLDLLNQFIEKF